MARPKKNQETVFTPVLEPGLGELKAKLRKKFHLLRDDQMNYDTKEALLTYVSSVLGMGMGELRSKIVDL